jgi:hypothetical protein
VVGGFQSLTSRTPPRSGQARLRRLGVSCRYPGQDPVDEPSQPIKLVSRCRARAPEGGQAPLQYLADGQPQLARSSIGEMASGQLRYSIFGRRPVAVSGR